MKHKAQDSLDLINSVNCSYLKEFECSNKRCIDCKWDKSANILQDLINCQFTLEEIKLIQIGLLHIKDYEKPIYRNIKHKIIKQKEMWVE